MTEDKDNWQDIVSKWQQVDVNDLENDELGGQPSPTNKELITRVNRDVRNTIIETVLIVVLYLACSGFILMEIIQGLPSVMDYGLYSFFLFITLTASFYTLWCRRNTWRATGHNSKDYITLLLKQATSRVKLIKLSKIVSIAFLVPAISILVFILGMWLTGQDMKLKHTLVLITITAASMVLIAGYFHLVKQNIIAIAYQQQLHLILKGMS